MNPASKSSESRIGLLALLTCCASFAVACNAVEEIDPVTGLVCRAKPTKIDLVWNAHAEAERYEIRRYQASQRLDLAEVSAPIYADFGLTNGTTYSYDVIAVRSDGRRSKPSDPCAATPGDRVFGNFRPTIISIPITEGQVGVAYAYDVDAVDPDPADVLTYSLAAAPSNMTIDAVSGLIDWTPTAQDLAGVVVTVRATDPGGLSDAQAYRINVSNVAPPVNRAPVIVSVPVLNATAEVSYAYDVDANDPDGDLVSFSLQVAPTGMTIDLDTGLIEWTPTVSDVGLRTVTVRASDPFGAFDEQDFEIVVAGPVNTPPVITSVPIVEAVSGESYTYDVDASDDEGDVVEFSLDVAPAGMMIDADSGQIDWTPTLLQVGPFDVSVRASDPAGLFDVQNFVVTVAPPGNQAPTVQALLAPSARPAQRFQIFFGEDANRTDDPATPADEAVRPVSLPNAGAARDRFLRELASDVHIETFEDLPTGPAPAVLTFGSETVEFLSDNGTILDVPAGTSGGRFPISGSKLLEDQTTQFAFSMVFANPIGAIGFFATDFADRPNFSGQLVLDLLHEDGGQSQVEVPHSPAPTVGSASGSALYFGMITTDRPVVEITFRNAATNVVDAFGFDDIVIARPDQVRSGLFEGETAALAPATFSDFETDQTHSATVEWRGDTIASGALFESAGSGTVDSSRLYLDDANTSVEVCVTDSEGATGCDETAVVVQNLPPRIECSLSGFRLVGVTPAGMLLEYDTLTGRESEIAETGFESWGGLDWHPQRGRLYGIVTHTTDPRLATLDPATGAVEIVAAILLDGVQVGFAEGLAFDPTTGALVATISVDATGGTPVDFTSELLVSLDPDTAVATRIGLLGETSLVTSGLRPGQGDGDEIEFVGGQLVLSDGNGVAPFTASYVEVDRETGATRILREGAPNLGSMAYDDSTGILYVGEHIPPPGQTASLYRVDPSTGTATRLASNWVDSTLAVVPPASHNVTIDFDALPGMNNVPGDPVPIESQLSDAFLASHGVVFSSQGGFAAVSRHEPNPTVSPPNVMGGVTANGLLSYAVPVTFSFVEPSNPTIQRVTDFVSIRGERVPTPGATATMEAFDRSGISLGSATALDSSEGLTLSLRVPGIHSVRLTQNSAGFGLDGTIGYDDLSFNVTTGCSPGGLYAISAGELFFYDVETERGRSLGSLGDFQPGATSAMTFDPVRGVLFAALDSGGAGPPSDPAHPPKLARIDPASGITGVVGTIVMSSGVPVTRLEGLDYNAEDGQLYASLTTNPTSYTSNIIAVVDQTTAVATEIGRIVSNDIPDPNDADELQWIGGALHGLDGSVNVSPFRSTLYRLDITTGQATIIGLIGNLTSNITLASDIANAESLGTLFTVGGDRLLEIDPNTLEFTTRFEMSAQALAFAAPGSLVTRLTTIEGEATSAAFRFSDPGVLDTHTGNIDWGDGSIDPANASSLNGTGIIGGSHVYRQNGAFDARFCVTDDDAGEGCMVIAVSVLNATPRLEPVADQRLNAGDSVDITTTFVDAGREDSHTATMDWGDGSEEEAVPVVATSGGGRVDASHLYSERGLYSATLCVEDDARGRDCVTFEVRVNGAPNIVSAPPLVTVSGAAYAYPPSVDDDPGDTLTFFLDAAPAGMSIDSGTGLISWTPLTSQLGDQSVDLRVVDASGLFDSQSFIVAVVPDIVPPTVTLTLSDLRVDPGGSVTLTVIASDNGAPPTVEVLVNGVPVPLDENGQVNLPASVPGVLLIEISVTDEAGNTTNETTAVAVTDPADVTPPVAILHAPDNLSQVSFIEELIGTATDSENFFRYRVALAPGTEDPFVLLTQGFAPVTNDVVAQLDATRLENGYYRVRLIVEDVNGAIAVDERAFHVTGQAKVGLLQLFFTDLTIPLAGIPISVERMYDSRIKSGRDFGIGWSLALRSGRVTHSAQLGIGWAIESGSGPFGLPCQTTAELLEHATEIRLSDTEFYVFAPTLSSPFSIAGGCVAEVGYEFVRGETPNATLQILDGTEVFNPAGSLELQYPDDFSRFAPKRFRLATQDGRVIDFDGDAGGIVRVADPNGNFVAFSNNGVTHSSGASIAFSRDALGRIESITDPSGNQLVYEYDAAGDLVAFVDALGNRSVYTYAPAHYLSGIEDPFGHDVQRNEFDADGRLIALIDANGNRFELDHDLAARQERYVDALGHATVSSYDAFGNVTRRERQVTIDGVVESVVETYVSDDLGNEIVTVDADGIRTETSFDGIRPLEIVTDPLGLALRTVNSYSNGSLVETVDAEGNRIAFAYDTTGNNLTSFVDPLGNVRSFSYDANGSALDSTDATGTRNRAERDGSGRVTLRERFDDAANLLERERFEYDANGNRTLAARLRTVDGSAEELVHRFEYDAMNRLVAVTDPLGGVNRTAYDAVGRIVSRMDALGRETKFNYDAAGFLVSIEQADGEFQQFRYDAIGNRIEAIAPDGASLRFEYDELNRRVRTIDPDGGVQSTIYTPAGRIAASVDPLGNRIDYEYDSAGRQVRQVDPEVDGVRAVTEQSLDAIGRIASITDPNGQTMSFEAESIGRIRRITFADGTTHEREYDALDRLLALTDEAGRITRFEYDGAGRLVRVTLPAPGDGTPAALTTYEYDEVDNLISETDALGRVRRHRYDALGRLIETELPSGATRTWQYDPVGNLISETDLAGETNVFEYDSMNRLVRSVLFDGTVFEYAYTERALRSEVRDPRGLTSYAYDPVGRLLSTTHPGGERVDYEHNPAGQLVTLSSPNSSVSYAYDARGRLTRMGSPAGATTYRYDTHGNLAQINAANGTVTEYATDMRHRVSQVRHLDAGGSVLASFDYTRSPTGRITQVVEHDGSVETYAYDALDRLVSEVRTGTAPRTLTYEYDAIGNRTRISRDGSETDYTYDADDRLLAAGSTNFDYDANGNMVERSDTSNSASFEYDARNELVRAVVDGEEILFESDADGNRVARHTTTSSQQFLIDSSNPTGLPQVLESVDPLTGEGEQFSYGVGLTSVSSASTTSFFHQDATNNVKALSDAAGQATDAYTYDGYGNRSSHDGESTNLRLFRSESFDPVLENYDLRARDYDPTVGRFNGRDPFEGRLTDPRSRHPYLYAHADPVNLSDPTGRFTLLGLLFAAGEAGGLRGIETLKKSATVCRFKGTAVYVQELMFVASSAFLVVSATSYIDSVILNQGRGLTQLPKGGVILGGVKKKGEVTSGLESFSVRIFGAPDTLVFNDPQVGLSPILSFALTAKIKKIPVEVNADVNLSNGSVAISGGLNSPSLDFSVCGFTALSVAFESRGTGPVPRPGLDLGVDLELFGFVKGGVTIYSSSSDRLGRTQP